MWEEQYVVFNSGSGHTHLLDPIAALLVQKIANNPGYDDDAIIRQMAESLDLDATEEFRQTLEGTLSKLSVLGLVEAVVS